MKSENVLLTGGCGALYLFLVLFSFSRDVDFFIPFLTKSRLYLSFGTINGFSNFGDKTCGEMILGGDSFIGESLGVEEHRAEKSANVFDLL